MMNKITIKGKNGYDIPCLYDIPAQARRTLLVCHGFGSSKESSTGLALAGLMAEMGFGWVSFDFPAHGDSPVDGGQLRVGYCLDDIAAVGGWAEELAPEAELCYFGSSFGAYILGLYLALRPHSGNKAMLRCAAMTMPELFRNDITDAQVAELQEQGWFMLEERFGGPLKITRDFIDDLDKHDAFAICRPGMAELLLIHGAADDVAPPEQARRFAAQMQAPLIMVEGAGHRLDGPGHLEQVLAAARDFFSK